MQGRTRELLVMQGFCPSAVDNDPQLERHARWTPLSYAACGIVGLVGSLWIGSGWFFVILGLLTLTGGLTTRSIYDRVYNATVRHLLHTSEVPQHGAPRRFGCTIGGIMYIVSGLGFLAGNVWLAYIPAVIMVVLATIAGLTHWCFASTIYGWIVHRDPCGGITSTSTKKA